MFWTMATEKKIFKYSLIGILALYLLALLVGPLVTLNLLSNKHVNYSRVFTSEEAGLSDSDTLWLKSDDGYRIHVLETKPEVRGHGLSNGDRICLAYRESSDDA